MTARTPTPEPRHCDEYIDDPAAPECLRRFLSVERLPADEKYERYRAGDRPALFADYNGKRWRVVMASRTGDLGLTENLQARSGYSLRLDVEDLTNFGDRP